jgi:3-oxoadipyl-CoA thiolase
MALLLAGLPEQVPGVTLNRLCASGLDAVGAAGRAIKAGEIGLAIAGGVESMTRAPLVMGKAETAFQRSAEVFDTTIGWRFINPLMKKQYGVDSMPETGENVAAGTPDLARRSGCLRPALAAARRAGDGRGLFRGRDHAGVVEGRQGRPGHAVDKDEHPRGDTTPSNWPS